MASKMSLFDGTVTAWQQALLLAWAFALVSVVGLWAPGGVSLLLLSGDLPSGLLAIGQITGLLATFFALTQFLLMGRIAWIERAFGLDRLAGYHRLNGYAAIILIVLHPLFIVGHHSVENGSNFIAEYITTLNSHQYAWLALVGEILFITVVISSIYVARKHLKFEAWYYIHLTVYAAIVLSALHQFVNGSSLLRSSAALYYWLGLYIFVALNLLVWRFGLIAYNYFRFRFSVSDVVAESATTTSLYITGRQLNRLRIKPGQFIMIRLLTPGLFLQEHPFTVSATPKNDMLRLTIRTAGDYTAVIKDVKPGTSVFVSGPFGRFTRDVAVKQKQLLIAGGIGITPIAALAKEAAHNKVDTVVLYSSRTPDDTPLRDELDALARDNAHIQITYIYSDTPKGFKGITGRLDGDRIQSLVPDLTDRDVYICGPPPMITAVADSLVEHGVPPVQIHFERFNLI
jgi:predicted ferric reductase